MLTSKPELSPFDSPRSLEGTLGLEVAEDLSLLPSQNSVPLNLEITSELPVENQTVSTFSLHGMARAAFLTSPNVKV